MNGIERVGRARIQLVNSNPFFGVLALHLDMQASTEFDTMATDGKRLMVNEAFADSLSDAELRGVLAHEVMHCAAGHIGRLGNRDPELFNEAADYAINQELIDMGFVLPDCALIDSQYSGWTAEQIYGQLAMKPKKEQNPGAEHGNGQDDKNMPGGGKPGNDPGKCGGFMPSDKPGESEAIAADWKGKTLMAAAIAGKQAGSLPGSIQRLVDSLRAPEIAWREVLRRFVTDSNSRDYSWSRPNRRHIGNGLYLPSLISDGRARLIVFIDTSGSIDAAALEAFKGELQAMLDERAADAITVAYCDSRFQGLQEFEAGDILALNVPGGGGTDFKPAMDWIAANGQGAAACIYFTDLRCNSFGSDPGLPVIWANWARPRAVPFGEVIQIDGHA